MHQLSCLVCLLLNPDLVGVLLVFQMLSRKLQNVLRVLTTHRNFNGFFFGPSHGILVFCPLKLMHLIVSISPFGLVTCEASFVQHVLRVSLQTYFWMKSDTAQPPEKFALDFGWEDQNGLSPVYFVGQTSSDFLKDLLCTYKGKSSCS